MAFGTPIDLLKKVGPLPHKSTATDPILADKIKIKELYLNTENVKFYSDDGTTTVFQINSDGTVSIGAAESTVTVANNLTITGDLLVSGTTTTVNTVNLLVEDPLIIGASGNAVGGIDTGILFQDGESTYRGVAWDQSASKWVLVNNATISGNTVTPGDTYGAMQMGALTVTGDILPSTDETLDLGSSGAPFALGYIGAVYADALAALDDSSIAVNTALSLANNVNLLFAGASNIGATGAEATQIWVKTVKGDADGTLAIDTGGGQILDINAGSLTLDTAGTFSIDGVGASNVTATSGNLTLSTVTTGSLILSGVALVDIDAGANLDIDVTGTFDMLSTGVFSIDGTGASNVTATAGNLTLSTLTSGSLILSGVALVDIDAGANLDIDVTGSFDVLSTGVFSIDGTGASNVTATAGNLTLSTVTSGNVLISTTTAGDISLNAAGYNKIEGALRLYEIAAPSQLASYGTIYINASNAELCFIDSAGNVTQITEDGGLNLGGLTGLTGTTSLTFTINSDAASGESSELVLEAYKDAQTAYNWRLRHYDDADETYPMMLGFLFGENDSATVYGGIGYSDAANMTYFALNNPNNSESASYQTIIKDGEGSIYYGLLMNSYNASGYFQWSFDALDLDNNYKSADSKVSFVSYETWLNAAWATESAKNKPTAIHMTAYWYDTENHSIQRNIANLTPAGGGTPDGTCIIGYADDNFQYISATNDFIFNQDVKILGNKHILAGTSGNSNIGGADNYFLNVYATNLTYAGNLTVAATGEASTLVLSAEFADVTVQAGTSGDLHLTAGGGNVLITAVTGVIQALSNVEVGNDVDIVAATGGDSDIGSEAGYFGTGYIGDMYLDAINDRAGDGMVFNLAADQTAALTLQAGAQQYLLVNDSTKVITLGATGASVACTVSGSPAIAIETTNDLELTAGAIIITSEQLDLEAQETTVYLRDNATSALMFKQDTNEYLSFVTTNDGEHVKIWKDLVIIGSTIDLSGATEPVILLDEDAAALSIGTEADSLTFDTDNDKLILTGFTKIEAAAALTLEATAADLTLQNTTSGNIVLSPTVYVSAKNRAYAYVAGESIAAGNAVKLVNSSGNLRAMKATSADQYFTGIAAVAAAQAGDTVYVIREGDGITAVKDSEEAWAAADLGTYVYRSTAGLVTKTEPSVGYSHIIGTITSIASAGNNGTIALMPYKPTGA